MSNECFFQYQKEKQFTNSHSLLLFSGLSSTLKGLAGAALGSKGGSGSSSKPGDNLYDSAIVNSYELGL